MADKRDLGLGQKRILIAVARPERGLMLQQMFSRMGMEAFTVVSLFELDGVFKQFLPHLVIAELKISDGHATDVADRLRRNEIAKRVPILCVLNQKNDREAAKLREKKVHMVVVPQMNEKIMDRLISEIFKTTQGLSPYSVPYRKDISEEITSIESEAVVLGRIQDQIIVKSQVQVSPVSKVHFVPIAKNLDSVHLEVGTNVVSGSGVFNIFPLRRSVGSGRSWLAELNQITQNEDKFSGERILCIFDQDQSRSDSYKRMLGAFSIRVECMQEVFEVEKLKKSNPNAKIAMLAFEPVDKSVAKAWLKSLEGLCNLHGVNLIWAGSGSGAYITSKIRQLEQPFGLGVLLDSLDAAFENSAHLENLASGIGQAVSLKISARLLSLDEVGGILETSAPLTPNMKIKLQVPPALAGFWKDNWVVQVLASRRTHLGGNIWLNSFEVQQTGLNRLNYFEKLQEFFSAA